MYNARIYKLYVNNDDFYIGSTKQKLKYRLNSHIWTLKNTTSNSKYFNYFKNNIDNINIELIEEFKYNDYYEVLKKEQYYINILNPTLNTNNSCTTFKTDKERYSKGKIYSLYCADDVSKIYIGSTINSIKHRLNVHLRQFNITKKKSDMMNYFLQKDISSIRIEIIEYYPCNDKFELESREKYWITHSNPYWNKILPTRNKKEWNKDNIEFVKLINKNYRENNKDKQTEYLSVYRKENKEKINNMQHLWYEKNKDIIKEKLKEKYKQNKSLKKSYQKEYYSENKEDISLYQKKYREKNKEKLKEQKHKYNTEKILCEVCNIYISQVNFSTHKKTKKHVITTKEQQEVRFDEDF
jgi:hypothetical protein